MGGWLDDLDQVALRAIVVVAEDAHFHLFLRQGKGDEDDPLGIGTEFLTLFFWKFYFGNADTEVGERFNGDFNLLVVFEWERNKFFVWAHDVRICDSALVLFAVSCEIMKAFYAIVLLLTCQLAMSDDGTWYDAKGRAVKLVDGEVVILEQATEKPRVPVAAALTEDRVFPVRASWGKRRFYRKRGRVRGWGCYSPWWDDWCLYPVHYRASYRSSGFSWGFYGAEIYSY